MLRGIVYDRGEHVQMMLRKFGRLRYEKLKVRAFHNFFVVQYDFAGHVCTIKPGKVIACQPLQTHLC